MSSDRDPIEGLIPASLRAALARRELRLRRPVVGVRHGAHRSLRPGVGQDFRDYRAYVPGDDPRQLDWRAAARSQKLVVRQTESEEELDVFFVLDGSGGMAYGEDERGKWRRASSVAAALASVALRQGDRVGLIVGRDGRVDAELLEPTGRRHRLRDMATRLSTREPAGDCPWPALLATLAPKLATRRRALVVLFSDFLDPGGTGTDERDADLELLQGLASLRASGHDVALLQILHADERTFPWDRPRVLELEDPRGRRSTVEGPGSSLRAEYLRRLDAHQNWLARTCEHGGLTLTQLRTEDDVVGQVLELLRRFAGGAPGSSAAASGGAAQP